MLALLILAALAVTLFIGCGGSGGSSQSSADKKASGTAGSTGQKAEDAESSERASGDSLGHPYLGSADAPVVLTEYSDYQWLFCGKFAREVEPKLYREYVEDGTLRIEWRDFPYRGEESVNAAVAARAAQAQGKFWRYHDLLYENQSSGFSDENLVAIAKGADLDVQRFEDDYEAGRYAGLVQKDFQRGQSLGVSGTPTFSINGQVLVGLQPVEVFENAIEDARREAEGG